MFIPAWVLFVVAGAAALWAIVNYFDEIIAGVVIVGILAFMVAVAGGLLVLFSI